MFVNNIVVGSSKLFIRSLQNLPIEGRLSEKESVVFIHSGKALRHRRGFIAAVRFTLD